MKSGSSRSGEGTGDSLPGPHRWRMAVDGAWIGEQLAIHCRYIEEALNMSDTKVQKWGNSMALRIPAGTMRAWGVQEGQAVALKIEGGALIARPAQRRYSLAELLAQCDFSRPMGKQDRAWLDGKPVGLEEI